MATKTTTAAKTTAAPTAAPKANGTHIDYAALAVAAQPVAALPKATRNGGGRVNELTQLVQRSLAEGKAFGLPAIPTSDPDATLKTMQAAIRRAASLAKCGVSIRHEVTEAGLVVTFQAKDKK